jgi:predicted dehydrogenase
MTARVALIGAAGHGASHLRHIAELRASRDLTLVGLCDIAPVPDAPAGVPLFAHHEELLAATRPDVVIVCTPPHTHLGIAEAVVRAGADVLLEKPPVLDLAQHERLIATLAETGRACQVGFQALGSAALARLRAVIAAGKLGRLTGIGVRGTWFRPDRYFSRAPWVGRASLDGRPVLDGALVNPFAHALMQVLAIAGEPVSTVEVERYRAHDIEVDDTASLRLRFASGLVALIAVTLCAEAFVPGEITVTGTDDCAVLEYPTDRLREPGQAEAVAVPGRVSLLANLIAHRADRGVALVAPLAATAGFTALLAPIVAARTVEVAPGYRRQESDHLEIAGVNAAVEAAAARYALFSELPVPWARPSEEQP